MQSKPPKTVICLDNKLNGMPIHKFMPMLEKIKILMALWIYM